MGKNTTFHIHVKSEPGHSPKYINHVHIKSRFQCYWTQSKGHNRCTQETFLKGSDFDVNMVYALRAIPSFTMKSIREVVY